MKTRLIKILQDLGGLLEDEEGDDDDDDVDVDI